MATEILLTHGYVALVDDEDAATVGLSGWHVVEKLRSDGTVYRYARKSKPRPSKGNVMMHRVILGAPEGIPVDHRDGNGLNNTRANLRLADARTNQQNKRKYGGASRYKGVWRSDTGRWSARIHISDKATALGTFAEEWQAAYAYDQAARRHFGDFAQTNFPIALLDVVDAARDFIEYDEPIDLPEDEWEPKARVLWDALRRLDAQP